MLAGGVIRFSSEALDVHKEDCEDASNASRAFEAATGQHST